MTTNTPNLNLVTYNSTTDGSATFLGFRTDLAGVANSNFTKLDTFAGGVNASLVTLSSNKSVAFVAGLYTTPNYYTATVSDFTAYTINQIISFVPDTTINGTVVLNINSIGTKTMYKKDSVGNKINFESKELLKGKEYLFRYDGTDWVWISSNSVDQIYAGIGGEEGNLITVSSGSTLKNSGSNISSFTTLSGSQTLTNKRVVSRTGYWSSGNYLSPSADLHDVYLAESLSGSVLVSIPTGTPMDGQSLIFRILDNGTSRALTWTTSASGYRVVGEILPTTTTASKTTYVGCLYNANKKYWDVLAVSTEV